MRVEIKEEPFKAILFWLSKNESTDEELMSSLKNKFPSLKKDGYQPIVYISGNGNLEDAIYQLIKYNLEEMVKHPEKFKKNKCLTNKD